MDTDAQWLRKVDTSIAQELTGGGRVLRLPSGGVGIGGLQRQCFRFRFDGGAFCDVRRTGAAAVLYTGPVAPNLADTGRGIGSKLSRHGGDGSGAFVGQVRNLPEYLFRESMGETRTKS